MSKAFTKEDAEEVAPPVRRELDLPPGTPSYMTPAGARRIRAELEHLVEVARPGAVRAGEAGRAGLNAIDQRIAELDDHLAIVEVVDPATQDPDRVRFGATVTLADDAGGEVTYRIVGIPEADPAQRAVSFRSPVARSLLGAAVGDLITIRAPGGDQELEVTAIRYDLDDG